MSAVRRRGPRNVGSALHPVVAPSVVYPSGAVANSPRGMEHGGPKTPPLGVDSLLSSEFLVVVFLSSYCSAVKRSCSEVFFVRGGWHPTLSARLSDKFLSGIAPMVNASLRG